MPFEPGNLLALDVGERRVGVAIANETVGFAHALTTLEVSGSIHEDIKKLTDTNDVRLIVVGLPRGLEGQDTKQTEKVRAFVETLKQHITLPMAFQDEALTSHKAETELGQRKGGYDKGEVDALAATYILEDYIMEHPYRSAHV